MKHILFLLYFCVNTAMFAQINNANDAVKTEEEATFYIKGSVSLKDDSTPISDVDISNPGHDYAKTTLSGDFRIKVKIGDEITISHPDIETVKYIVKNKRDNVRVVVEAIQNAKKITSNTFDTYISNAKKNYKTNANKGIDQITKALLLKGINKKQEAEAYGYLGDIQLFWKQYDLAISNYKSSLKYSKNTQTQLKLAESYYKNANYNKALQTYNQIPKKKLSPLQQVNLSESIGDVYSATQKYKMAEKSYQKGLDTAKKHQINSKITDLNSKLGEVSFSQGNLSNANDYFNNSLNLATEETPQRASIEKERVADFYNSNQDFDKEIELRKKNLSELENINDEVIIENSFAEKDSLTTQKTNYKIASAYVQQAKYKEAIPYLKESIALANKKNDLVIEKDATRKLSEIYKTVGNNVEALNNYQSYVTLVDKLYLKKEQEITHATKFSRDFIKHQQRISSLENERALAENQLLIASKNNQLIENNNSKQRVFIYGLLASILLLSALAFYMYRNNKQQKLNNNLLALRSLRSQMNPHFIFNALNSVNSFIAANDERTANRYLTDFSKLMRSVLENSEQDFIPLENEIELLQRYTKLEHFRFQDKFDYDINIDEDVILSDFSIPPMLLQPYVENAVWHGLRYKETKGILNIIIKKHDEETLAILIEDNGIGREKSKALKTKNQQKHQSKGLGNIKKRVAILNEMYQDKVTVDIADIENDGGTKVTLTLKKEA